MRISRRLSIAALMLLAFAAFCLFAGAYASDEKLGHAAVLTAWGGCFFSLVASFLVLAVASES